MNTSVEQKSPVANKKSASTRRIPEKRLSTRNEKLIQLGDKIARVDEVIEAEKIEIASMKKTKTSDFVIKAREENLSLLTLQRSSLVSQFDKEKKILAEAIARNTQLI